MKQDRYNNAQIAFGKKLREIRLSHKMTQQYLANMANVELSTLNRIELGKAGTSLTTIFALSDALQIQPKELFDFSFKPDKD